MENRSNPAQPPELAETAPAPSVLEPFMRYFLSLMAYALSILLVWLLLRAYAHEALPIMEWVSLSSQPDFGVLALAVMMVSVVWILLSFLVISNLTLPGPLKVQLDPASPIRSYARALLGEAIVFMLAANVYLMFIPPVCKPPAIVFKVDMGSETTRFTPQSEVTIPAGVGSVVMSIDLLADQNIELHNLRCAWSAAGAPVDTISPPDGCAATLFFKERTPGSLLLSAQVRNQYCPAVSIYSLTIRKD